MYRDDDYVGIIFFSLLSNPIAIATRKISTFDYLHSEDSCMKSGHVYVYARSVRSKKLQHVSTLKGRKTK
jgi:hypothetical protein